MTRRRPSKRTLLVIGIAHLAVTAATWRDISERPATQIRGRKVMWRVLSGANTLSSVAYVLLGRRSVAP